MPSHGVSLRFWQVFQQRADALDLVTANVGPKSERELTKVIEALIKEKTIIMIAHRLKTVRHADNILVIDGGKIVQSALMKI